MDYFGWVYYKEGKKKKKKEKNVMVAGNGGLFRY